MKRFLVLAILILALPKTMFCASYLSDREFRDLRNNSACLARILAHDPYNVTKIHDTDSIRSLIKAGIDPDWGDGWGHGLLHKLLAGTNNDCHGERGDKQMPFFPQKTLLVSLIKIMPTFKRYPARSINMTVSCEREVHTVCFLKKHTLDQKKSFWGHMRK